MWCVKSDKSVVVQPMGGRAWRNAKESACLFGPFFGYMAFSRDM